MTDPGIPKTDYLSRAARGEHQGYYILRLEAENKRLRATASELAAYARWFLDMEDAVGACAATQSHLNSARQDLFIALERWRRVLEDEGADR